MTGDRRLVGNIILSVVIYLAIQAAIVVISIGLSPALHRPFVWFLPATVGLHAAMGIFLLYRRSDLRHTETGEAFSAINGATHLTLLRLSFTPTILLLAVAVSDGYRVGPVLIGVVVAAFLSDFLDGQVARRLNQTTEMGKYLDSSTDYAVLLVLAVALVVLGITPVWYFGVLTFRLVGFAVAMVFLTRVQGHVRAETTFLGKAAIFSAMTTYAFEIAGYVGLRGIGDPRVVLVVEIVSAAIVGVSMIDKWIYLRRRFREVGHHQAR